MKTEPDEEITGDPQMFYKPDEEITGFINTHRHADINRLALQAPFSGQRLSWALAQIKAWQTMSKKVPAWATLHALQYPDTSLSVEQCSGEETARYKTELAGRLTGENKGLMADLTGGLGVDFSFMARLFLAAKYIEPNGMLCRLAAHNFRLLELRSPEIIQTDSKSFLEQTDRLDLAYLDPARRCQNGRKAVRIADCSPNVENLLPLLLAKARLTMIKCSPILDIADALRRLPHVREVHLIGVNNECKELVIVVDPSFQEPPNYFCRVGKQIFRFTEAEERCAVPVWASNVGAYLYEPDVTLLKASAYRVLSQRYRLRKLHANSHLYTGDEKVCDFPGRIFQVEAVGGFGKKELKTTLNGLAQGNLTVRNFPQTVATLRKRLRLAEGGAAYFFATTLSDEKHVLIRSTKMN